MYSLQTLEVCSWKDKKLDWGIKIKETFTTHLKMRPREPKLGQLIDCHDGQNTIETTS